MAEIHGNEKYLVNASIYIKNAVLELKNVTCECESDSVCKKCEIYKQLLEQKNKINELIQELI